MVFWDSLVHGRESKHCDTAPFPDTLIVVINAAERDRAIGRALCNQLRSPVDNDETALRGPDIGAWFHCQTRCSLQDLVQLSSVVDVPNTTADF